MALTVSEIDWHHWCRLCAKEDPGGNSKVFIKNENQAWNSSIAMAIGKYFWVNIKPDDSISEMLCMECHTLLNALMGFAERVERVQSMFNSLNNKAPKDIVDIDALRKQFNLQLDGSWEHIIKLTPLEEFLPEETVHEEEEPQDQIRNKKSTKSYQMYNEVEELINEIDEEEVVQENYIIESEYEETNSEILQERSGSADEIEYDLLYEWEEEEYGSKNTKDGKNTEVILKKKLEIEEEEDIMPDVKKQKVARTKPKKVSAYKNLENDEEYVDETIYDQEQQTTSNTGKTVQRITRNCLDNVLDELKIEMTPEMHTIFTCSVCSKSYKKFFAYKKHMQEEHNMTPKQQMPNKLNTKDHFPCTMCSRKFQDKKSMEEHVESIHKTAKKPYICDTCGKCVKTLSLLNEHRLVHTDECPIECPICKRRFKNRARLKIHSEVHDPHQYVCNICGLKLNTRRTFTMHKLVHSTEKQFKCNVCDAAFKRAKALKAHLILHTGLRPYECNFCGKTFSNGSNCRMHKRKTHPEELALEEAQGTKVKVHVPALKELRAAISNSLARDMNKETNKKFENDKHQAGTKLDEDELNNSAYEVVSAVDSIDNEIEEEIICEIVEL